jgi:TPR repeat protein
MIDAGDLFLYGYYLPQNPEKAFEYFSRVHEAGATGCSSLVAACYLTGIGAEQDLDKVMPILQRASDNGDPREYLGIGVCLTNMTASEESCEDAANYFRASIDNGYYESCLALSELFKSGRAKAGTDEKDPVILGANAGHDACLYRVGTSHLRHAMDNDEWAPCEDLPTPLDSFRYGLRLVSRAAEHGFRDAVAIMDSTETFTLADGTEITIEQLLKEPH